MKSVKKDFECVELGDLQQKDKHGGKKPPCRVIHFSSGETMEEYSVEDEDEHAHTQLDKHDPLSSVDTSKLTWGPYVWFHMWRAATNTVSACDYVGEKMASLFGITSAKYQYAIDEYNRTNRPVEHVLTENEVRDSPVPEEAESGFQEKQEEEIQEQSLDKTEADDTENLNADFPPEPKNLDDPVQSI